ncbi:MAG TPA: SGNH/GDSL hydrolase family protein [Microlunatus sp.]
MAWNVGWRPAAIVDHDVGVTDFRQLAVLGSSFAAGPGIPPILDRAAGRSANNYGRVVAERLGARLTDLSVSGATTETLLDHPQRVLIRKFPAQLSGLPADADLVMITAGGNDLDYIGSLTRSAIDGSMRSHWLIGRLARRRSRPTVGLPSEADAEQAITGLTAIVAAVRDRAPQARVLLVDYPTLIGADAVVGPDLPLSAEQRERVRRIGERLAAVFAAAATRSGAGLVAVSEPSHDHGIGSAEPWVNGFRPPPSDGSRFHPNAAGMRATAELIMEQLLR